MEIHEDFKEVTIKDRKFVIRKFDARTGSFMLIKVTGLIAPMLKGLDLSKIQAKEEGAFNLKDIDIPSVVSGLTSLTEQDFNYVHDKCLQVCFEELPAGSMMVMNSNGSFGVIGLETDSVTTLALVAHTLMFNVTGFFGAELFSSISRGILSMKSFTAKT